MVGDGLGVDDVLVSASVWCESAISAETTIVAPCSTSSCSTSCLWWLHTCRGECLSMLSLGWETTHATSTMQFLVHASP